MNAPSPWSRRVRLARFVLDPRNAKVSAQKIVQRRHAVAEHEPAVAWADAIAVDSDAWIRSRDAGLADEAERAVAEAEAAERSHQRIAEMGGAADCALAYWLVRHLQPDVVVETGVAAGWSSRAFLTALEANGHGRLLSSDLPYPGMTDSDAMVGVVVPEGLRDRWRLDLDGDDKNLRRFVRTLTRIDLFHFDSDKSRAGRSRAMALVEPLLTPSTVVVMDDIGDNLWFRDWVAGSNWNHEVLRSGGKFVGIATRTGDLRLSHGPASAA